MLTFITLQLKRKSIQNMGLEKASYNINSLDKRRYIIYNYIKLKII